jgi:hypothetical protein
MLLKLLSLLILIIFYLIFLKRDPWSECYVQKYFSQYNNPKPKFAS